MGHCESMRYLPPLTAFLAIAAFCPAEAQIYPGQDVTVNTSAAGTQVLLYPGGKYGRIVPALRQPGQDDSPIHLHMPYRHHVAQSVPHHQSAVAELTPPAETPAPPEAPVPTHTRRTHAPVPAAPPPVQNEAATNLSDFSDLASVEPSKPATAPARPAPTPALPKVERKPAPQRVANLEPPRQPAPAPAPVKVERKPAPQRVANLEPPRQPAPRNPDDFGAMRGAILFAAGASDPSVSAVGSVKTVASELNSAMVDASSRVQLVAYGGQRGDKSSDTRRISLKRALVIRQLLIDDGVPSERIDVRAMGGADDNGPMDRVDVFLKS